MFVCVGASPLLSWTYNRVTDYRDVGVDAFNLSSFVQCTLWNSIMIFAKQLSTKSFNLNYQFWRRRAIFFTFFQAFISPETNFQLSFSNAIRLCHYLFIFGPFHRPVAFACVQPCRVASAHPEVSFRFSISSRPFFIERHKGRLEGVCEISIFVVVEKRKKTCKHDRTLCKHKHICDGGGENEKERRTFFAAKASCCVERRKKGTFLWSNKG